MVEQFIVSIGRAVGQMFLYPLFYFSIILSLWFGFVRIHKERQTFHSKIHDITLELGTILIQGLGVGLLLSLFSVGLGVTIAPSFPLFLLVAILLFSLMRKPGYLAPAYTIGGVVFLSLVSISVKDIWQLPYFPAKLSEVKIESVLIVLAMLLLAEAFLIIKYGGRKSSPRLFRSKRGQMVGGHEISKLWMVPLFFLIPGSGVHGIEGAWPVLPHVLENFSIICLPIPIGIFSFIQGELPSQYTKRYGKRIFALGIFAVACAVAGIYVKGIAIILLALIVFVYVFITMKIQSEDTLKPPYFSHKNLGIVVLSVLPNTPAYSMGIEVGEIIVKVNGVSVQNMQDLYEALHMNRAHVKLDIVDHDGQMRIAKRALYEGDHHELGIISVKDEVRKVS